jgi:hypothetical protein
MPRIERTVDEAEAVKGMENVCHTFPSLVASGANVKVFVSVPTLTSTVTGPLNEARSWWVPSAKRSS